MFSFLNSGNIQSVIKCFISKHDGFSSSDTDKIKYALLNHSTAMRSNLSNGFPIFNNVRMRESLIEKNIQESRRITASTAAAAAAATTQYSSSLFNDYNDIRIDNSALAIIMAKEMAFLNRTIQMISLITDRYQEEQEDLNWRSSDEHDCNDNDDDDDQEHTMSSPSSFGHCEDLEQGYDHDDSIPSSSGTLHRSHSHSSKCPSGDRRQNQLASTFLIASGRLYRSFNELCEKVNANIVAVNSMTRTDCPHNEENLKKQLTDQTNVISTIYLHFEKFDAHHREPVVHAFHQLRDLSVFAWQVMSMLAFSNLFRLTEGTEYATRYCHEDAIFTQGRDYTLRSHYEEAAVPLMRFPTTTKERGVASAEAAAAADEQQESVAYD